MTSLKRKIIEEYYNIRSVIYTLLIFMSLLFLMNLKHISLDLSLYIVVLVSIVLAILSEYLFSISKSAYVYHHKHPLRELYKKVRLKHLYNIILLPIVQFICCAFIIYFSNNILVTLFAVFLTTIFTYFTLLSYTNIYENNLELTYYVEEFFDASKYLSFAFISYLLLLLHIEFLIPRSFIAIIIGGVQFVYILSAIWRRNKINLLNIFLSFISGIIIVVFVYVHLVNIYLVNEIGLIEISTAHVLFFDYIITSLLLRWIDKKLSFTAFIEYILVLLIGISLLVFSF